MSSPTTRRHPRTLQEAFGPYATGPVHDKPAAGTVPERVAGVVVAVVVGIAGAAALLHWWAA